MFGSELRPRVGQDSLSRNNAVKKFNDFHVIDEDTKSTQEGLWFPSSVQLTLSQKV